MQIGHLNYIFASFTFVMFATSCGSNLNEEHHTCLNEVNATYDKDDIDNKVKHMEMCMLEKNYVFTNECNFKNKSELLTKWCYRKTK